MDLELTGRTAIVTGASQGIGRSVALRLAREGARVVACARGKQHLATLAGEIAAMGGQVLTLSVDVTDHHAGSQVAAEAIARFGAVDILVNNAGRAVPVKLADTSEEDWIAGLELNLLSAVRFTRACLPGMVGRRWGRVVNIASTTARLADPLFPIYGAAKAGLINFSRAVAAGHARDGVTSNAILPGVVSTPLVAENIRTAVEASGTSAEEVMARMMERWPIPARRLGEPEEVADLVAFLVSERSGWITGVALPIDGGTIPVAG